MGKTIIQLVALIVVAIAVFFITDAKNIAKKHFNKNEEYGAVKILKIIGIIIAWIGLGMLYMVK